MIEDLDTTGYILQTVVYLFAPYSKKPKDVFYLYKIKPSEPTTRKFIGWGGNFENGETIYGCAIRELKEELNIDNSDLEELILQGVLIRDDFPITQRRLIYILKATLKTKIDECIVKNEGNGIYLSIDFHQKPENQNLFLQNDLFFLDDLFFSNKKFETVVSKDGKIKHTVF